MSAPLITGWHFEAHHCERNVCFVRIPGATSTLICGHCEEVVYGHGDWQVLRNHRLTCDEYGVATWYATDLDAVAHKCGQPSAEVTDEELVDLTASADLART